MLVIPRISNLFGERSNNAAAALAGASARNAPTASKVVPKAVLSVGVMAPFSTASARVSPGHKPFRRAMGLARRLQASALAVTARCRERASSRPLR